MLIELEIAPRSIRVTFEEGIRNVTNEIAEVSRSGFALGRIATARGWGKCDRVSCAFLSDTV